jgi:hypothetical protein
MHTLESFAEHVRATDRGDPAMMSSTFPRAGDRCLFAVPSSGDGFLTWCDQVVPIFATTPDPLRCSVRVRRRLDLRCT